MASDDLKEAEELSTGDLIAALRDRFGVDTDTALANALNLDKRAISAWRSRDVVPTKYRVMLDKGKVDAWKGVPTAWGPLERAAFQLTLFRYVRAMQHAACFENDIAADPGQIWDQFRNFAPFWFLFRKSELDILDVLKKGDADYQVGFILLMNKELTSDGAITAEHRALLDKYRLEMVEK